MRRLVKNKVAMVSLVIIVLVMIFSFIVPIFLSLYIQGADQRGHHLAPMEYSEEEQARIDAGEKVFPHIFGTDKMGRDYAIRVMVGSRISYWWAYRNGDYFSHWFFVWFHSGIFGGWQTLS